MSIAKHKILPALCQKTPTPCRQRIPSIFVISLVCHPRNECSVSSGARIQQRLQVKRGDETTTNIYSKNISLYDFEMEVDETRIHQGATYTICICTCMWKGFVRKAAVLTWSKAAMLYHFRMMWSVPILLTRLQTCGFVSTIRSFCKTGLVRDQTPFHHFLRLPCNRLCELAVLEKWGKHGSPPCKNSWELCWKPRGNLF